jgi:hypothetical protein
MKEDWWVGFTLRESVYMTLCATLMVIVRLFFRLGLRITGHSMLFTIFFILLAKHHIPKPWTGTATAFLAGILAVIMGLGKAGPLLLPQYVLPGLVVDLLFFFPFFRSKTFLAGALVGGLAAFGRFPGKAFTDAIVGMDFDLAVIQAFIKSIAGVPFGIAGGILEYFLIRRMSAAPRVKIKA